MGALATHSIGVVHMPDRSPDTGAVPDDHVSMATALKGPVRVHAGNLLARRDYVEPSNNASRISLTCSELPWVRAHSRISERCRAATELAKQRGLALWSAPGKHSLAVGSCACGAALPTT